MGLPYLLNCMILAYAPFVLTYTAFRLKDFSSNIKLIGIGAIAYLVSQGIKILTFALLAPSQEEQVSFEPIQETLKNVVGLIDIAAVYYALNYVKTSSGESLLYKTYAVTLGWAGIQTFLSYFFYILINAFSSEFQWECVQTSIQANIDLVSGLDAYVLVRLVLILTTIEGSRPGKITAMILLIAKLVALPLVIGWYEHNKIYSTWLVLAVKAGTSFGIYVMSKIIHTIQ